MVAAIIITFSDTTAQALLALAEIAAVDCRGRGACPATAVNDLGLIEKVVAVADSAAIRIYAFAALT